MTTKTITEVLDRLISRQAAIDDLKIFTKDCNPEHFVGHSNFIEYMDTVGIRSFGNWQYANGFNMGLTAAEVAIEKLPSAHPDQKKGKWIDDTYCSICGWANEVESGFIGSVKGFNFCPNCGKEMEHD